MDEITSWWLWMALPVIYLLAYFGGYLSSIRKDARRRRIGHRLYLAAFIGFALLGIFTPPNHDVSVILALIAFTLLMIGRVGHSFRRSKSTHKERGL